MLGGGARCSLSLGGLHDIYEACCEGASLSGDDYANFTQAQCQEGEPALQPMRPVGKSAVTWRSAPL